MTHAPVPTGLSNSRAGLAKDNAGMVGVHVAAGSFALAQALALLGAAAGAAFILWNARNGETPPLASATGGVLPDASLARIQSGLLLLTVAFAAQAGALAVAGARILAARNQAWAADGMAKARFAVAVALAAAAPSLPFLAAVAEPSWAWLAIPALLGAATVATSLRLQRWQIQNGRQAPRARPTGWVCPRCTRGYTNVHGSGPVPMCPQCG